MKPTGFGMRVFGRGASMMFSVLRRITGVDLLEDLAEFFQAFSGMVGGFRERARRVNELLSDPRDLVPGRLRARRASRSPRPSTSTASSSEAEMPFGGVIVNKVHYEGDVDGDARARSRAELAELLGDPELAAAGRRQLRRLPRALRARPPQHRAARRGARHRRRDRGPLPRPRRPRPRRPDRDQPLPVRLRQRGAGRDRRRRSRRLTRTGRSHRAFAR